MPSIIVVVYDFLDKIQFLKEFKGAEGLDPARLTSNVGPQSNTISSYFSGLSIYTFYLCIYLCCMPSALLGFSTQNPRVFPPTKKSQEKYKANHEKHRTKKSFKVEDRVWL